MYFHREIRLVLATIIAIFAIMAAGAFATDFYVANTGDDTDGLTWGTAWNTIQEGIDSCSGTSADAVRVAQGTYVEHIVLDSYVTLEGGYRASYDGDTERDARIYVTIIDGGAAGSVVTIDDKDGVTIDGFTIKNGKVTSGYSTGGGIYCSSSSPTITNNLITGNYARIAGGGIRCDYYSSPTISNNSITGNWTGQISSGNGGGISCFYYSSPRITDNQITGNSADWLGGGINCGYCSSPIIENNTITGNWTDQNGSGGGICYDNSSPTITNNTIAGNSADWDGAGIYCYYYSSPTITNNSITGNSGSHFGGGICCKDSSPTITNNTIADNSAAGGYSAWGFGGGIYCSCFYYSSPTITNCLITHNQSVNDGGGIYCSYSSPTITNCTIADNRADSDGGGMYSDDSTCAPVLLNCILWGDSPNEIAGDTTNLTVTYSDVKGGWTGNINKDPGFVPLDGGEHTGYYLKHLGPQAKDSACIDAGDNTAAYYGLDTYTTRTDGTHDGGTVDMGYHYPEGYSGKDDTFIELISFTARPAGSRVVLNWETGAEIDNAGFVVYRAIAGTVDYQQLSGLIPAQGTPTSGASYSFTDSSVEPGVSNNYWLVDIDTSGKWTVHGPASARLVASRVMRNGSSALESSLEGKEGRGWRSSNSPE